MSETEEEARLEDRPTRVRWMVFALACGCSFLLYLHRYTWNIVGPHLQDELGLTNTQTQFLFSLFYYTYAGAQVPSGIAIDRFGPHLALGLMIVAWSGALAGIAQGRTALVVGAWRLVFGLAQAGCYPALTKVTRSWFPASRRTFLQGWIATTSGRGGGALSPIILGTILMGWFGGTWRFSLCVLAGAGVCFGVLFWKVFRNTPALHPRVNQAERDLIAAGSSLEVPAGRPVLPFGLAWKNRSLRVFVVQQFLDAGSDVAFVSLIGTYFLRVHGFEVSKTGWLASLPMIGGAIGGIVGGWLNDFLIARTGRRRWSRSGVGAAGKVTGCLALLLVIQQSNGESAALVLLLAKFFSDWSQPTVWGTCTDLGGRFSATVFGIINTAGTLGGVIMPIIFGTVLDHARVQTVVDGRLVETTSWTPLFLLLATMYLGSGFCWLLIDCTRTIERESPAPADPGTGR